MAEFFGFGGYTREPEGYLSWQHLCFVTLVMMVMIGLAILLGLRRRHLSNGKDRVLATAAIAIDTLELFKIVLVCVRSSDPLGWLYDLPLFLCSIQLITIPLAAFGKGRIQQASLDMVCIFGVLGAVLGTYGAGNNYSAYPVLSFDNVVSAVTHGISGFCSLYIMISGQGSMEKRNMPITFGILSGFCIAAYAANILLDYNYMFLIRGDGTPYEILYSLVGGSPVLYPIGVVVLFLLYISLFYLVWFKVRKLAVEKTKVPT